ncbi:MAG: elongation factor G [bacterium]
MMPSKFKNVAIAGEPASGKTQLCEALVHKAGVTTRLNAVAKGQSIFDSQKDEKERQISIDLALGHFEKNGIKVNIIDTPGYADFIGEVLAGVWASDFVLIVVDAATPLTFASRKIYDIAKKYDKPVAFFINGMGKEAASWDDRLSEIKNKITINVAPFYIASKDGDKDILNDESDTTFREGLIETVASTDDALLEKYLSQGTLKTEELKEPLVSGIAASKIVPVLSGDALTEAGIENLINFLTEFVAGPQSSAAGKCLAQVFKISAQGHTGEIALTKILQGTIKQGKDVFNVNKNASLRAAQIVSIQGSEKQQILSAEAGDIVGLIKLKDISAGNTIAEDKTAKALSFVEFPFPVYSRAVRPATKGEEEKVATSLASIRRENPIVTFGFNSETKEIVLSGMGNVQLDVIAKRIISTVGTKLTLSPPKIAYKETFTVPSDMEGKYKRQTGGHGQFGHCFIRFRPLERGKGFEFVNKIVGGAIPSNYIPAVEKGLIASLEKGLIAGFQVVDVQAELYDGSFHEVDSSNIAFEIAASMALKKAAGISKPIVLEPIMSLGISVPDEFTGAISGDVTSRRGRIVTFDKAGDIQIIKALVPASEILEYINDLRSMTKGQGEFKVGFSHYDPAPANIMKILVDSYEKQQAEGR